ncbi:MAG: DUF2461 domain-containing protein [Pseudomonadota bacterium]
MTASGFSAFDPRAIQFLRDIEKNNDRVWFASHKQTYETYLKQPANEFARIIARELEALTGLTHDPKVFRIYRDLRFSKDKRPYNAHIHLTFYCRASVADWFFALAPGHLTFGVGTFGFEKDALKTFRERVISRQGTQFAQILRTMERKGMRITPPQLKRIPAGYPPDHPRADLLRHKALTVWSDMPDPMDATKPSFLRHTMKHYIALKPLFDWLGQP